MPEAKRRDVGRISRRRNPPDAVDQRHAASGGLRRCAANPPYDGPTIARVSTACRRHDLVWLDPATAPDQLDVAEPDRAVLQEWLDCRLPLVKGRQDEAPDRLRLGFTLPGTGPRRRVEVRVPQAAVLLHGAPPSLEAMLRHAPAAWQPGLADVALAFRRVGLIACVYGSLVTQAFSGEACVRPDSDVDILIDCDSREAALAALAILARHGEGAPRIDGEIRMADGRAAAWRELARALALGGQVLAKSETDLQLLRPEDFSGGSRSEEHTSELQSPLNLV